MYPFLIAILTLLSFPIYAGWLVMTPEEEELAIDCLGTSIRQAQEMINIADLALNRCPKPVMSLTPYKLNYPPSSVQTIEIVKDFTRIEALGIAAIFIEKSCFHKRALTFLKTWSVKFNLIHQPIYPKDLYPMRHLFKGYSLVRERADCETRRNLDEWLYNIGLSLSETTEEDVSSLTQAKRMVLTGSIGYLLGKEEFIEEAEQLYEILRTKPCGLDDAFAVKCEAKILNALLEMAIVADRNGCGWTQSDLLERLDKLLPYIEGQLPAQFPGQRLSQSLLSKGAYFSKKYLGICVYGRPWQSLEAYLNTLHFLRE